MKYRDIVTSHLSEDTRILASVLALRRIYHSPAHEIYLCIYSGFMDRSRLHSDLVTCIVVFQQEALRIMFKLWTDEIKGDRQIYIESAVEKLKKEGKTPFHLIRDAKKWCHLPFTQKDQEVLGVHGVLTPLQSEPGSEWGS